MKKLSIFLLCFAMLFHVPFIASADGTETPGSKNPLFYFYNETPAFQYFLTHTRSVKPDLMIGDVNFDGKIDAVDALFAIRYTDSRQNAFEISSSMVHADKTRCIHGSRVDVLLESACMEHNNTVRIGNEYDRAQFNYYWFNSVLMADVTGNDVIEADDVLMILQYAVGKRTAFDRTDTSTKPTGTVTGFHGTQNIYQMFYVDWPDVWEPGMYVSTEMISYNQLMYIGCWIEMEDEAHNPLKYFDTISTNEEPKQKIGDVNFDGVIDEQDILFVLYYADFGSKNMFQFHGGMHVEGNIKSEYKAYAAGKNNCAKNTYYLATSILMADVNGDGKIDGADVFMLAQYVGGSRSTFPRKTANAVENGYIYPIVWPDDWDGGSIRLE